MAEQQWTPGFGKPYFKEPKFYVSPSVKEAKLPDDAINSSNTAVQNQTRYYTNDEILQIWAKPLTGYQVSEDERKILAKNPYAASSLLLTSEESPCKCHIQNMMLDKCSDPKVGTSNKSMLQDTACNYHYYKLMKCMMKHWNWYELRREALRQALPEDVKSTTKPATQFTRYDVDPKDYYKNKQ